MQVCVPIRADNDDGGLSVILRIPFYGDGDLAPPMRKAQRIGGVGSYPFKTLMLAYDQPHGTLPVTGRFTAA